MIVVGSRLSTVHEFEGFIDLPENSEKLFELIDGEIVEKVVTREHGIIAGNIITDLNIYLRQHQNGRAGVEVHHHTPENDQNNRLPDVSVIMDITKPVPDNGTTPYMPDLAVEIKSPTDSLKKLREKIHFYLAHGTKIGWLVIPEKRLVDVYTPDDEFFLGEDETLSGGDMLPGFTLPVKNIFWGL